jgi:16S rRNA (uracil1498-N3)-methyltransferase
LICAPEATTSLRQRPAPTTPLSLLVGPEGGWEDDELRAAQAAGCEPITLGPRVLRTETAGIVALAAAMTLWGDV